MFSGLPWMSRLRNRPSASDSSEARSAWLSRYEQGKLFVDGDQLLVAQTRVALAEAHLVEREALLDADRERARHHLQVELAVVAGGDFVETMATVGDHTCEHVQTPGRALGVGLGANLLGQVQLLDQRHQIGPVALERRSVAQVDLIEGEVLDLLLDGRARVGQKAAAQRPSRFTQAQIHARGLDRLRRHAPVPGRDQAVRDRLAQTLGR